MTPPTQRVLRVMLADPARKMYGLQICTTAGLPSGTIHPVLARLEGAGWLESHWEESLCAQAESRPRRRYYKFTAEGAGAARLFLAQCVTGTGPAVAPAVRPGSGVA
jgi:PadR family transcriptional regulator